MIDTLFMAVLFLAKMGTVIGCDEWVEEAKYRFYCIQIPDRS